MDRDVTWQGFFNARDLGGLPTSDGGSTRTGALLRSADLRFVTEPGWQAAYEAGFRTIVDLRNDDEVVPPPGLDAPYRAVGMQRVHIPLDGVEDVALWEYLNGNRLNGTPLYYRPFLEHKPERCAAVVAAIAQAPPGGVIFHCAAGRDRTGLIALLLLSLAGVQPEAIAADYALSNSRTAGLFAALGRPDEAPRVDELLARLDTTAEKGVLSVLAGFDAENYLAGAGVTKDDLVALRDRVRGSGNETVEVRQTA